MSASFNAIRLFTDQPLEPGETVELSAPQSHYLRNVMRQGPGSEILLFNGRDGEFSGEITRLGKQGAGVALGRQTRAQAETSDLWLLFAPIKRERIDWIVEKATELGASRLCPVMTGHTQMARVNTERLRAIAIEAAEQSERLSVPIIDEPVDFKAALANWQDSRRLFACLETGTAPPIAEAVSAAEPGPIAALIGPEGGFTKGELDALHKLPFVSPVGLGSRVLRADTAALAALAVLQSWLGDWRSSSRKRTRT